MPIHRSIRSRYKPLAGPALLFAGLTAVWLFMLLMQGLLSDNASQALQNPFHWLFGVASAAAVETLSNAAEVVAAVLAIAVTVVAIVVELAANRYSHQITNLFLREPVNLGVLGIFVLTAVESMWVAAVFESPADISGGTQIGLVVVQGMVTLSLIMLVPYIYYVFTFLSPINVIDRISANAYTTVLKARDGNIDLSQRRVESAIDELQDVARSAIQQSDRGIAIAAVDAITDFVDAYVQIRDDLPRAWFDVSKGVADDPDFVALEPQTIADIEAQGIWVERKVFRRYLSLMGFAAMRERDVANLIGINTQRTMTRLAGDKPWLRDLGLYTFNSYLRATINAGDLRTAYYLMNQYRIVGEWLLNEQQDDKAMEVADYLREYGQFAHTLGSSFLLESAAFYVMRMVERAYQLESAAVDPLLSCLLNLDMEIKEEGGESQEASLLGVRRAQMHIGTLFLMHGDEARAARVVDDLHGERYARLDRMRQAMLSDDRLQFWELTDLGVNFRYLPPERRPYLERLLELIRAHR